MKKEYLDIEFCMKQPTCNGCSSFYKCFPEVRNEVSQQDNSNRQYQVFFNERKPKISIPKKRDETRNNKRLKVTSTF